jgi:hypothetical protein
VKAGRSAAVFAALLAAHEAGDHVVQTDAQAAGKVTSWRAMAGHVAGYHAAQVAALATADAALGLRLRASRVAVAVAVSAGTHALLDRRWPVRRIMEATGSAGFAHPRTTVYVQVDGLGRVVHVPDKSSGVPHEVAAHGPVPLNGPYLADQSLHKLVLWACSLIAVSGGER